MRNISRMRLNTFAYSIHTSSAEVHQYADLDSDILQNTITNRLGDLRGLITRLSAAVRRED